MAPPDDLTPLIQKDSISTRRSTKRWIPYAAAAGVLALCGASLALDGPTQIRTYLAEQGWLPCEGCPLLAPYEGKQTLTFTLHSACKSKETKSKYRDFFATGTKQAWLVRHNYGSGQFFEREDALKMNRVKLSDDEYGYTLTTDEVDFEYGFMFTKTNDQGVEEEVREVGKMNEALLADTNCTQMYYPYFNRVTTLENVDEYIADHKREFIFGSCDHVCPDDYVDTSNAKYLGANGETIPDCGSGTYSLGPADDAGGFTLISAVLSKGATGPDRFGRMAAFRDGESSENYARWIVAGTDKDRADIKMAYLDIVRDPNTRRLTACVSSRKRIPFPGNRCRYIDCSPMKYDVPSKARDESQPLTSVLEVSAPLFILPQAGDARPEEHFVAFTNDAYLTTHTLHEAGQWGEDIDARRIILTAAGTCGGSSYSGDCIGVFSPFPMPGGTENEQTWLLVSFVGEGETSKMVKVRVYVENGAVKISTVNRAWGNDNGFKYSQTRPSYDYDPYRSDFDAFATYQNFGPTYYSVVASFAGGGYGVGTLKWLLSPEMLPSLSRMDEVHEIPETA